MEFKRYRLTPRVMDDLKKRSTIGIIFYCMIVCIVLFTDNYYTRHPEFSSHFLWLILGICLLRALHLPVSKWQPSKFERVNILVFTSSIVLTALIWGVGLARFMTQAGEADAKLLMMVCSVGLCSGGVVSYIPEFRLSIAFSLCMLVPAIVTMIILQANLPFVFVLLIFLVYLFFMARRGNREYWDALENEYFLEEKSRDLERMSRTDSLTDIYNRRYFDETFSFEWNRAVRNQTPISVILCDIDHFKHINDQYGHLAGDEYLKAVSRVFKTVFRRKTDTVARYGGEEFIVLVSGDCMENVTDLAETARSTIEKFQLKFETQIVQATISIGLAVCVPHQNDEKQFLISRADKALYKSKNKGRNRVTQGD